MAGRPSKSFTFAKEDITFQKANYDLVKSVHPIGYALEIEGEDTPC